MVLELWVLDFILKLCHKVLYTEKCLKLMHNTFMFNGLFQCFLVIKYVYKLFNSLRLSTIRNELKLNYLIWSAWQNRILHTEVVMRSQRQADVHYFFNNSMTWSQLFCLFYDFCASRHCLDVLFQDICQVFVLKMLFCEGLISYASHPNPSLLIPKRHFRVSNRDFNLW